MVAFESEKTSNDIMINDTMSDDEEVASDKPPRYLLREVRVKKEFDVGLYYESY